MTGLQATASALEMALMNGAAHEDLLDQLQHRVEWLCQEISTGLGIARTLPQPVPGRRPPGPLPEAVARLLAMLEAADGSCVAAVEHCLAELQDSDWAPTLHAVLAAVRNFDFDTARELLAVDMQTG
jgi:hypothetical protein